MKNLSKFTVIEVSPKNATIQVSQGRMLDVNTLLHGITRSLMLRLPGGALVWLVRQALIVSKEPIVANIDIKTFDGCGIGSKKINLINCVQSSVGTDSDPARNGRMAREMGGRHSSFSPGIQPHADKLVILQTLKASI